MILGKGMMEGRAPIMGTHGRDHVCMDTLSDILSMEQVDQEFEKYQTVRASVAVTGRYRQNAPSLIPYKFSPSGTSRSSGMRQYYPCRLD